MNRARIALLFVLIGCLSLSCTFSFLDEGDLSPSEAATHWTWKAMTGGAVGWLSDADGATLSVTVLFADSSGRVTQAQGYDASESTLRSADLYSYDGSGNLVLHASFGGDQALRWFQAFEYNADSLIESEREYDSSSALSWARRFSYGADSAATKVILSASYDGAAALDGAATDDFDGEGKATREVSYGSVSCSTQGLGSEGPSAPILTIPETSGTTGDRSRLSLSAPALPPSPSLALPDQASLDQLGRSGSRYWEYDSYGVTELTLDRDWYPIHSVRKDSRLGRLASADIEWDSANHRPKAERSYYGSTLALDLSFGYDSSGFPEAVSASGAGMLLPLDFRMTYGSSHCPLRLDVSSSGGLLQYFTYDYSGLPSAPTLSLSGLRSIDPFDFLDQLKRAGLVIHHFDGDGNKVEDFAFSSMENGLRISVLNPDGSPNGRYEALYDSDDVAVSLSAFATDGSLQWAYEYGYRDALMAADASGIDFGRLSQTYLTDDVTAYAFGFMRDILL